ncbi:MAG: type 1 glutamine amidotransferase [Nitrososphaerales archaeon]
MLIILNNDSTTLPELVDSIERLRAAYQIIRYDQPIKLDNYRGVILTGRRSASDEINRANIKVIRQALMHHKPLLGICYGAEILALAMGGALTKLGQKVYGHQTIYVSKPNRLTEPYLRLKVFESHAFNISRLPKGFNTLGYSEKCENEIIAQEDLMFYGVQFHPECSSDGLRILSNFMKIVGENAERF